MPAKRSIPYLLDLTRLHSQVAYILAGLTAGGGTIGFLRAGSVPSMVAGCGVGALYVDLSKTSLSLDCREMSLSTSVADHR